MYSRKTGVLQTSSEGMKKIENFNKNLREQYQSKSNQQFISANQQPKAINKPSTDFFTTVGNLVSSEEFILITLILLLLFDANKDFLIIGILAMLLLLNQ